MRKVRRGLNFSWTMDGAVHCQVFRTLAWHDEDEAFVLRFHLHGEFTTKKLFREFRQRIDAQRDRWLEETSGGWFVDLDKLVAASDGHKEFEWLRGRIRLEPEVITSGKDERSHCIQFEITQAEVMKQGPRKIFLSHKGVNKPMVRGFFETLRELGFDPWLDEDAMTAGANLERALLAGMSDSCAAVFFVTSSYKDSGYLATEVDYAIAEKNKKGAEFSIITIVFDGKAENVPDLLRRFVWKQPSGELEALREIIRALPIRVGPPVGK